MPVEDPPLEPGATFHASDGAGTHALKLSALLRRAGTSEVLGLVGRGTTSAPTGARVTVRDGRSERAVGRLEAMSTAFPKAAQLDPLFQIVRFDDELAADLEGTVRDAAVSRDMERNVLSNGLLRVRKLNPPPTTPTSERTDLIPAMHATRGFLTGNVLYPLIERREGKVTLSRASVARGRGQRDFARPGDGGSPVLSASGALLGFVVGRDERRTLVLPAEDVMNEMDVHFVVAKGRPGELRRARIRPRRQISAPRNQAAE